MPIGWMRKLDTLLGLPLARLLAVFTRRPASLYGDIPIPARPRRVICGKLIGMGSTVLMLPVLRALKDAGIPVTFVTLKESAELVRMSGLADEILIVRPSPLHLVGDTIRLLWRLRKSGADCFIDLEPSSNLSAVLARLSGAPLRLGFLCGKPSREMLFTHLISYSNERHLAANFLLFASRLGISPAETPMLPPPPAVSAKRPGSRNIVVNVNASELSAQRLWPEESWVSLCTSLTEAYPECELYFPGVAKESDRVRSLVAALGKVAPGKLHDLTGKTRLPELFEVIAGARLVVTVDSGILHIAAWLGTPVVALFGPESPHLVSPLTSKADCISARLACSPCLNVATLKETHCRDNQCMKRIEPGLVLAKCRAVLEKRDDEKAA